MSRRIFVSYKYSDTQVRQAANSSVLFPTTARRYVDYLQDLLSSDDHINMGEADDESLDGFKDETIESKLRDKIFWSSTTIVLASKGMRNLYESESDQWIPWEIAYSLKNMTRANRTCGTNAMLLVAIPDEAGDYGYFRSERTCDVCNCMTIHTDRMFKVIGANMFNRKTPRRTSCPNHAAGQAPHAGDDHSYIYPVKWDDFVSDVNKHLDVAWRLREHEGDYNIVKQP